MNRLKPIQSSLSLAAVLVLAACATTKAAPDPVPIQVVRVLDNDVRLDGVLRLDESLVLPPTCPAGVRVFEGAYEVEQPYVKVALFEKGTRDDFAVIESQKKKAAALGANGLILSYVQNVAIYIPDDMERVRTACAR